MVGGDLTSDWVLIFIIYFGGNEIEHGVDLNGID